MAAVTTQQDHIAQQDALRPYRAFVNLLGATFGNDQSMAATDGIASSPAYQYQTVGSYGYGIEGANTMQNQQAKNSNLLLLLAGAAMAYMLVK